MPFFYTHPKQTAQVNCQRQLSALGDMGARSRAVAHYARIPSLNELRVSHLRQEIKAGWANASLW